MHGGERMMLSPQNQAPSDNTATGGRTERERASALAWREMLDGQHTVNLENRRHQERPNSDMHPPNTPQTTADTPTILSENAPLAEARFWQVPSINRLQTPTKLVLNRAFQVDINKIARLAASDHAASQPLPPAEKAFRPDGTLRGGENVRIR